MIKTRIGATVASLALGMSLLLGGCGQQAPDNRSVGTDTTISQNQPGGYPPSGYQTGQPSQQGQSGMSNRKKVVMLAGAALLYYLYKKHEAAKAQNATVASGQPQLYRSRNGGIYYRDANHNPVWLTVPSQPIQVPQDEVQRYAPDYQQYGMNVPQAPSGYRTQPFQQFDPSALPAG